MALVCSRGRLVWVHHSGGPVRYSEVPVTVENDRATDPNHVNPTHLNHRGSLQSPDVATVALSHYNVGIATSRNGGSSPVTYQEYRNATKE